MIRFNIKKPQTILKVLLALFFIAEAFYFCPDIYRDTYPNLLWSTTLGREAQHSMALVSVIKKLMRKFVDILV